MVVRGNWWRRKSLIVKTQCWLEVATRNSLLSKSSGRKAVWVQVPPPVLLRPLWLALKSAAPCSLYLSDVPIAILRRLDADSQLHLDHGSIAAAGGHQLVMGSPFDDLPVDQ